MTRLLSSAHPIALEQSNINPEKRYVVQIKANFEIEALPLLLQPIAYINPQWYLSSDWTTWSLEK